MPLYGSKVKGIPKGNEGYFDGQWVWGFRQRIDVIARRLKCHGIFGISKQAWARWEKDKTGAPAIPCLPKFPAPKICGSLAKTAQILIPRTRARLMLTSLPRLNSQSPQGLARTELGSSQDPARS